MAADNPRAERQMRRDCKTPTLVAPARRKRFLRSRFVIGLTLVGLAVSAPAALAQSGSEFDQYVPDLPDASGEKPLPDAMGDGNGGDGAPSDDGAGDSSDGDEVPPPSSGGEASEPGPGAVPPGGPVEKLADKGPAGEAAARFTLTTSQPVGTISLAESDGASPGSSLFDLLGGPAGGMGAMFPLLLVVMFGAAVVYALRRRGT